MSVRSSLLIGTAIACSGRTPLGVPVPEGKDSRSCADEVIATDRAGATALAIDGDPVFWGTCDGHVWTRQNGVSRKFATEHALISAIVTSFSGGRDNGVIEPFAQFAKQPARWP